MTFLNNVLRRLILASHSPGTGKERCCCKSAERRRLAYYLSQGKLGIGHRVEKTYENPSVASVQERLRHFKQEDHVRLYGRDFAGRLANAGFGVEVFDISGVPGADVKPYALDYPSTRESVPRHQRHSVKSFPHFLLVGNGPYLNRGCEAIVRGSMTILRREFGEDFRVTLATFESPDIVTAQAKKETDPLITHVALLWPDMPRWSIGWWQRQLLRLFVPTSQGYSMLDQFCSSATCALQIGGDNFSMDYGLLTLKMFMDLDDDLHRRGLPIVLWGASVGPFEGDPSFASEVLSHLQRLRTIMPRETASYKYLRERGFDDNLRQMSDPAFVMEPIEPPAYKIGCDVPQGAIGLNLSPLMARYVTGGDMDAWVAIAADIIQSVTVAADRDVLLIPHVTWSKSDDRAFLRLVAAACPRLHSSKINLVSGDLSAAELKWVISRCAVFAGARTHSTIAGISSCVPTLSLAYSRKASGLNQDIFGSQAYCVQPSEITPAGITERIVELLDQGDAVREHLAHVLPPIRQNAFQAGTLLRLLMENP